MKIVVYKESDVKLLTDLINSLRVNGFENAKMIAKIGEILDSGEIRTRHESPGKDVGKNETG